MAGFVLGGVREDGREGMDFFQLVIRNDHEEKEMTLSDGEEVIIGWLPFEGGEGVGGLFEEASDCVRCHVVIAGFFSQTRKVWNLFAN
jgi:hypothetical protein